MPSAAAIPATPNARRHRGRACRGARGKALSSTLLILALACRSAPPPAPVVERDEQGECDTKGDDTWLLARPETEGAYLAAADGGFMSLPMARSDACLNALPLRHPLGYDSDVPAVLRAAPHRAACDRLEPACAALCHEGLSVLEARWVYDIVVSGMKDLASAWAAAPARCRALVAAAGVGQERHVEGERARRLWRCLALPELPARATVSFDLDEPAAEAQKRALPPLREARVDVDPRPGGKRLQLVFGLGAVGCDHSAPGVFLVDRFTPPQERPR